MSNESRKEVLDIIEAEALKRGIPVDDFLRFAHIETGGTLNPNAENAAGYKGLFQFGPVAAKHYGIQGREFDARANTEAAAKMYLDNQREVTRRHAVDGLPYLSGNADPDGMDLYVAHQQGAAGYGSIQAAVMKAKFAADNTRVRLLGNIGNDVKELVGHEREDLDRLPDQELAASYVAYWRARFDQVRIPEKNIGRPSVGATVTQIEAVSRAGVLTSGRTPIIDAPRIILHEAYDETVKYAGVVRYGLGAKNPESGKVDCSGWMVRLQNASMREINRQLPTGDLFQNSDFLRSENDAAATIIQKTQQRTGQLLEGAAVTREALKPGMVIGEDNGPTSFDQGRYKGIDHIVMVVQHPDSGELLISQSRGDKGVMLQSLDAYLAEKERRHTALFAVDPLAKARDLIQDRSMDVARERTLSVGARGEAVLALQTQLNDLGYTGKGDQPLVLDKDYGQNTRVAVEAFQRDHYLPADGVANPATLAAVRLAMQGLSIGQADAPYLQTSQADDTLLAYRSLTPTPLNRAQVFSGSIQVPMESMTAPVLPTRTPDVDADTVRLLQERLNTLGLTDHRGQTLAATGEYDDRTRLAVMSFQFEQGLPTTGIPDVATRSLIEARATIVELQQFKADLAVPLGPAAFEQHVPASQISEALPTMTQMHPALAPSPAIEARLPRAATQPAANEPALSPQDSSSQLSPADPRHPDSPTHTLYSQLHERIPEASERRLLQFTAACHSSGITGENLGTIHFDEDRGIMGFASTSASAFRRHMTGVDLHAPMPTHDQAVQQIQDCDQHRLQVAARIEAQNQQMAQSGPMLGGR